MGDESAGPALTLNLTSEVNEAKTTNVELDVKRKGRKRKRDLETEDVGGDQRREREGEQKDFVSSLFNHNPSIPRLNLSSEVAPVHEVVFTSNTFADVGLHPYLIQNLEQQDEGISHMTSVQRKAIPVILAGKDALVKSQTGSGKTLAYALPIVNKLQELRPEVARTDGVKALVVVPTRELAVQSFEQFESLCRSFTRIVPGVLIGGEKKKSEKARIRKGINILISTPGRLIDHLQHTKCLSLKALNWLVLDEADRTLELGYERDIQTILNVINEQASQRQTILLSATLTTGIEQLSEVSLRHPVFVDAAVGEKEDPEVSLKKLTTPENLKQTFIIVPAKLRLVTLAAFILWKCRFSKSRKMLIFMSTQDMVDYHADLFARCLNNLEDSEGEDNALDSRASIEFLRLHGSMTQADRQNVFHRFRDADAGSAGGAVLLCTDVAARGLDLPRVDWIVQFNPPVSRADYVHRVGRTARIGTKGSSLLFLLPSEANFVKELEGESMLLAEMTIEQVLEKLYKNAEPRKAKKPALSSEAAATDLQIQMENAVSNDTQLYERASLGYVSYIRSYASYPKEARHIFCFKELHLGHLAKSFALRDPPSKITGIGKGHWVKNDERKREKSKQLQLKQEERVIRAQKKRVNQKALIMSEFASGIDGSQHADKRGAMSKTKKSKKTLRK